MKKHLLEDPMKKSILHSVFRYVISPDGVICNRCWGFQTSPEEACVLWKAGSAMPTKKVTSTELVRDVGKSLGLTENGT